MLVVADVRDHLWEELCELTHHPEVAELLGCLIGLLVTAGKDDVLSWLGEEGQQLLELLCPQNRAILSNVDHTFSPIGFVLHILQEGLMLEHLHQRLQ